MDKPHSPACERNRNAILGVLSRHFADRRRVLEIGSGTGQHAVHFAAALPALTWQSSDRAEQLPGIRAWLDEAALPNTPPPLELDVNGDWPSGPFDAVFSANTLHIMSWPEVQRLFARLPAVTSADARLRAIERDLHDGPQARLVAVAMQLGEARSHLAAGTELEQATSLVDSAHAATKETLVELREIVRGIHPPALDAGLPVALETLAARSPLPVSVAIDPTLEATRPLEPVLQSLVYYAVAELLANVAKHSGATGAELAVRRNGAESVLVSVTDDGRGGAAVSPADGTGLHTGLLGSPSASPRSTDRSTSQAPPAVLQW